MKKYIVKIEGNLFRPIKISCIGYKEAVRVYKQLKEDFMETETIISMNRVEVVDGEEILYTMYDKSLKKEKDFDYYINIIDEALNSLTQMRDETYKNLSHHDKSISDFYHALECVSTDELTAEEKETFFKNAEIELAKRRLAKFDFDINNSAFNQLNKTKAVFGQLKAAKKNSEKNKDKKQQSWNNKLKENNPYLKMFENKATEINE